MKPVYNDKASLIPPDQTPGTESVDSDLRTGGIMSNVWSLVILFFNIWTVFSTLFWISVPGYYMYVMSFFEILIEFVLLFEIITRIVLKLISPAGYAKLNLYHTRKDDKMWVLLIILIGSMPIYSIFTGLKMDDVDSEDAKTVSRILALKFLRSFEIPKALDKIEEVLFFKKFKTLVFVKFIKNVIYVILVAHLTTCSWLFLDSTVPGKALVPAGVSDSNFFAKNTLYFERNNMREAPLFYKYADALVWGVGALTGCNFSEVTPRTVEELVLSIFIMLMGILLLAKIFSDFASIRYLLDVQEMEIKEKATQAVKLCKILHAPPEIRFKVQAYYELDNDAFLETQHFSAVKDLPQTLQTDLLLSLNKNLIEKSNLFNVGSPDFVFMMAKHIYPQVSMPGDYITRVGEYANEMFFIKSGEVEVLATDNKTRINVLTEGGYFGEIGLLLTEKRTVYVRALTMCHLQVINKDDFNAVLDAFPQQKEFIQKIAEQRRRVCTPEEAAEKLSKSPSKRDRRPIMTDDKEDSIRPSLSRHSKPVWVILLNGFKNWACVGKGLDFRATGVILPTSIFHMIWAVVLGFAVFIFLMFVPYDIAFLKESDRTPVLWIVLEIICTVIYFLDIFVNMNTSVKREGIYVSNRDYVFKNYMNGEFIVDLIAFFPVNYIFLAVGIVPGYMQWIKALRFLKVWRCMKLLGAIGERGSTTKQLINLTVLAVIFIVLNNFVGCIEYLIAVHDLDFGDYTMLKRLSIYNILDMPLIDQDSWTRYIYFQYWAWALTSSGAYGDVVGVTPSEKYFGAISMLTSRVFFAFFVAEASAFISSLYANKTANLAAKTTYDQWMKHVKLPDELKQRTKKYNKCIWQKYQGIDENQILDDLPKSIKQEILEHLLLKILQETDIFPTDEVGLFSNIVKDFKFKMISKDEYIYQAGEIAEELIFIIDGDVSLIDPVREKEIKHLKQNDLVGDATFTDDKFSIRMESAKAKNHVSLGVLHLSCVKDLWAKYPTLRERMNQLAEQRKKGLYRKPQSKMADLFMGTLKDVGGLENNAPKDAGGSLNALKDDNEQDLVKSQKDNGNTGYVMVDSEENLAGKGSREDLEKTNRGLTSYTSKISDLGEKKKPIGFKARLTRILRQLRKSRVGLLSFIVAFEWVYRPFNLAFDMTDFNHPAVIILIEIFFMLMFVWEFFVCIKNDFHPVKKNVNPFFQERRGSTLHHGVEIISKTKKMKLLNIIMHVLYIIPFQWIFTASNVEARDTNFFLIVLQLVRLIPIDKLFGILHLKFFKKRYALANILIMLTSFFLLNHFFACILILLANAQDDYNNSWLAKIPAPQGSFPNNQRTPEEFDQINGFTRYIHALYWSYVTTSHIGVGDVVGINHGERVYSILVIALTTYLYVLMFGNLASLVDDLTPRFQKEFEANFSKVMEYVKTSGLGSYLAKIQTYYTYLWRNTKGVDENVILNDLPNSLKSDIFMMRYNDVVMSSKFFVDLDGAVNQTLFYYFTKKCHYTTYLKGDHIVSAGQEIGDIYVILEGEAALMKCDPKKDPTLLMPGDFFGGLLPNNIQIQDVVALGQTKVAVLPQENFLELKEILPDWYDFLCRENKTYKLAQRVLTTFRKNVARRKLEPVNNENSYRKEERGKKPSEKVNVSIRSPLSPIENLQTPTRVPNPNQNNRSLPKHRGDEQIQDASFPSFRSKTKSPELKATEKAPVASLLYLEEDKRDRQTQAYSRNNYSMSTLNKLDREKTSGTKKSLLISKSLAGRIVGTMAMKRKLAERIKTLKYYIDPNSHWRSLYELLHTFIILYSLFAIPIQVGMAPQFGAGIITMEVIVLVEQILHLIFWARTPHLVYGLLTLDWSVLRSKLREQGIYLELIGIIPLNLIFGAADVDNPYLLFGLLRLNRLILLGNLPMQLNFFSARYPKIAKFMSVLKPLIYLALASHFIACAFGFLLLIEPASWSSTTTFSDFLELDKATPTNRYIICLAYFLSISTTVGYGELIIYNNYERIIFILTVYFGDALFALILGWFGANSSVLPEKFEAVFNSMRKIDLVLEGDTVPEKVKTRLTNYFTFAAENQSESQNCLQALSGLLPETILKEMTFEQTRVFHNFPLIREFSSNKVLANEIVANLKRDIYFPNDYISTKGEKGSGAYMIADGTVKVISPSDDQKVLGTLRAGDYFGELGLYTETKRLTSFVAETFCVIYVVESDVLKNIFESFPTLRGKLEAFCKVKDFRVLILIIAKQRIDTYMRGNRKLTVALSKYQGESVKNILRACEIPISVLEAQKKNSGLTIVNSLITLKEEDILELDSPIREFIEEEEMNEIDMDQGKGGCLIKPRRKERRLSRIKIGKEKSVATAEAITVSWGINLS